VLPHEDLAPWYEKVVWLYVCRTWQDDAPDLEAARIHDRFGVTSWPHLFLLHPADDRVLVRAGRTTAALAQAFEEAVAAVGAFEEEEAKRVLDELQRARARVLALEALKRQATAEQARETLAFLEDPDVLVRQRALRVLTAFPSPGLKAHAEALLVEGNDAVRFELLDWLLRNPTPDLTPLLVRVFLEAGAALPSGNPNVLRAKAAACLEACGDARAIDALAPVARAADARNTTTRTVVAALGAIGARSAAADRARVVDLLLASWPPAEAPAANGSPTVAGRYALRLAEAVTKALMPLAAPEGTEPGEAWPDLPPGWSEEERATYVEAVTRRVQGRPKR